MQLQGYGYQMTESLAQRPAAEVASSLEPHDPVRRAFLLRSMHVKETLAYASAQAVQQILANLQARHETGDDAAPKA